MPMSGPGLGAVIKSQLSSVAQPTNPDELQKFAEALGQAIVDYITQNSIVVGVVTSGQGAGGAIQGQVT